MKAVRNGAAWLVLLANLFWMSALSLHVIRVPGSFSLKFIPKAQLTLVDTWHDARDWTPADLALHPLLIESLRAANKPNALSFVNQNQPAADAATRIEKKVQANANNMMSAQPVATALKPQPAPQASVHPVLSPATAPGPESRSTAPKSIFDFGQ